MVKERGEDRHQSRQAVTDRGGLHAGDQVKRPAVCPGAYLPAAAKVDDGRRTAQSGDPAADVGLPSVTWRPACTPEASNVQFLVRARWRLAEEGRLVKTMTYSESRAHYAETLNAVVDDREEVVITRAGHEPVVIVALADYESLKETAYLLRSPENARRLLASIDRLEHDGGIERDLLE
jgi:antitoxin YefM